MVLEHEIKSYEILSCTLNQCSFSLFIIFGTESKLNGKMYMDIITHTFFFFLVKIEPQIFYIGESLIFTHEYISLGCSREKEKIKSKRLKFNINCNYSLKKHTISHSHEFVFSKH